MAIVESLDPLLVPPFAWPECTAPGFWACPGIYFVILKDGSKLKSRLT